MRDDHRRTVEVGQVPAQIRPYVQARTGIQGRQRLVQQQQPRRRGERPGKRDPLRLAAGEACRLEVGNVREAHPVQPLRRHLARRRLRRPGTARTEGHVVPGGQVREQQVVLEHHADPALLRRYDTSGPQICVPASVIVPSDSGARPASARSAVDLPAPLGPSSATTSPAATANSMSSRNAPRSTTSRAESVTVPCPTSGRAG